MTFIAVPAATLHFSGTTLATLENSIYQALLEGFLTGVRYMAAFDLSIALPLSGVSVFLSRRTMYDVCVVGPLTPDASMVAILRVDMNIIGPCSRGNAKANVAGIGHVFSLDDQVRGVIVVPWCGVCYLRLPRLAFDQERLISLSPFGLRPSFDV